MKEACYCGRTGEVEDREPVMNGIGNGALQCTECGHVDDLCWISGEAALLFREEAIRRRESSAEGQRAA